MEELNIEYTQNDAVKYNVSINTLDMTTTDLLMQFCRLMQVMAYSHISIQNALKEIAEEGWL